MNTQTVTSLAVGNEPPNSTGPKSMLCWKAPFLELLGLLKVIDSPQPSPKVDAQRLCFQPSHDLSEISRIFLSVSTSSVQYDIDIKTIRPLGSNAIPPAIGKLQDYANHVLRRIQAFRDRLFERAVIIDTTCFLHVDLFTCPLCHRPLMVCVDCDSKVACSGPTCPGSLFLDCEQCFQHDRMSCHSCISKNITVPSLICCPMCQGWCCREDADWCAGLIIRPALGTEELAELSNECEWDCETILRSHPPKPGPCRFCTFDEVAEGWAMCHNSADDLAPDRCPSQTPFMTRLHLRAAHCPDCIDESPGHLCACGNDWICDTCYAIGNKSITIPFLITCPRCGVDYCTNPGADCVPCIDLCRGCKGVVLCSNCQEEEELPGDARPPGTDRPRQVDLTAKCRFCEGWCCPECYASKPFLPRCVLCNGWLCFHCVRDVDDEGIKRCPFCEGYVCEGCMVNHHACPGDVMLRNVLPSYSFI